MKRVWKVVRCLCMVAGVVTCCSVTLSVSAQAVTRVLTLNPYQDVA